MCWDVWWDEGCGADWAKASLPEPEPYMREVEAAAPDAPSEEDRGKLQSLASADQVRSVLAQGWSDSDMTPAAPASANGATRTCRWQQQVIHFYQYYLHLAAASSLLHSSVLILVFRAPAASWQGCHATALCLRAVIIVLGPHGEQSHTCTHACR